MSVNTTSSVAMRRCVKTTLLLLPVLASLFSIACGGGTSTGGHPSPQAPVFTSKPSTTATEGIAYSYNLTATDPSGGTVSFALTSGPGTISGTTLTWTPTAAQTGVANSFVVTATTSESASAKQDWSVTPSVGGPPTFSSTPPTEASEGVTYIYNLAAADPSGGKVSFALTTGPGTISGSTLTWTPTHAQSRAINNFTVTASTLEGGSFTQSWVVTPSGTINGTDIVTNVLASGNTVDVPANLNGVPINALLPDGSGGYTTIAGTGSSNGTFSITKVPAGVYLLQVGNTYLQLSASDFNSANSPNTAAYIGGRTGITYGIQASISLTASGFPLSTAQVCDDWWVPNLDINQTAEGEGCPGNPEPVAAGVVNETIPIFTDMDSSQGDQGYYIASTIDPAYTGAQSLVTNAYDFGPVPITVTNGSVVPITNGVLANPALQATEVAVQRSSFAALRAVGNPSYSQATTTFSVIPQLYGNLYGPVFYAEPYALQFMDFSGATTNFDLGSIQFGLVDPSEPLRYEVTDSTFTSSTVNGGTFYQSGDVFVDSSSPFTSLSPAAPGVGPVTSPMINGASFFQSQTVPSPTFSLSWNPPTVGTPDLYSVVIFQETLTNYCSPNPCYQWNITQFVGYFVTTDTNLTIPAGLLSPGSSYQFSIDAMGGSGYNELQQRGAVSLDETGASSASGLITIGGTGSDQKNETASQWHGPLPSGLLRERYRIQRELNRMVHEVRAEELPTIRGQ